MLSAIKDTKNLNSVVVFSVIKCIMFGYDTLSNFILFVDSRKKFWLL